MKEIKLLNSYGYKTIIKLNNEKRPYIVEEILNIHTKVYDEIEYDLEIDWGDSVSNLYVYLNEERIDTILYENKIVFRDNKKIFKDTIGFAQFSFYIEYKDGTNEWLYSEYLSVLLNSDPKNQAIDSMLKYVYNNQIDVLKSEGRVTGIGNVMDDSYDDFWSQIVLMEDIAKEYESSYGYFMANCRYKLEQKEVLDRVEKLQYIDSKTIQYITQHPEYLRREASGIKYGMQTFLPSKTLMKQNSITYDIYENRVVMGFLRHILSELLSLKERINSYLEAINYLPETENGYIVSSYILYLNAKEVLNEFLDKLDGLEVQYQYLVSSYSRILQVSDISMFKPPEPTAIFLNLPQYNRIYICIRRWFSKQGYNLVNERVILDISCAPAIYEAYVLIKIVNHIREYGYELKESKNVIYPKQSGWLYKNKNYNNTFVFEDDHSSITLYYEPVIYDEDRSSINGIGLYRNNSVSLNKESEEEMKGKYYVPDYVLKYTEDGRDTYMICDAKFTRRNSVKYRLMPELTYKYLTSISTVSDNASIKGLYVFYGINEGIDNSGSFYDKQLRTERKIEPRIEMIPLSETMSYSDQSKNAMKMLRSVTE